MYFAETGTNFNLVHCYNILSKHLKWEARKPKLKVSHKKQFGKGKVVSSALATVGGAKDEEEDGEEEEEEKEEEEAGSRPIGRKQVKTQVAEQKMQEKQLKKALSKKIRAYENNTLALKIHTSALQRVEDLRVLFMNPLSIENPRDRQMIMDQQLKIRERGIWDEPAINNNDSSSDVVVLDSN
ncbi:hypothetical protein J3Q64DRAFT_1832723 [Phycomyces blakesleeanus]|uniref:No apical meristem-associated C-terminal domain-containing protein n=1 Tax=Phycomyces blakesleeanus TaxID=4837 RepID=A0ABR3B412_PHYBL